MIGWLRTRVRKQPIIMLYFESENELTYYILEAWFVSPVRCIVVILLKWVMGFHCEMNVWPIIWLLSTFAMQWMNILNWLYWTNIWIYLDHRTGSLMTVLALTVKIKKSCSFQVCHLEVKLNRSFGFLRNWSHWLPSIQFWKSQTKFWESLTPRLPLMQALRWSYVAELYQKVIQYEAQKRSLALDISICDDFYYKKINIHSSRRLICTNMLVPPVCLKLHHKIKRIITLS